MIALTRLARHGERVAIVDPAGHWTYADLDARSRRLASSLIGSVRDFADTRVAWLLPPGADYAAMLTAVFRAGGIAVPLALSHPAAELEHVIGDSGAGVVVASPELLDRVRACRLDGASTRVLSLPELLALPPSTASLPDVPHDRRAMIVYTSGTTGKPKGVVTTHANIAAQVNALVDAWEWTAADRTLLVLPLHHVHGIINVVCSAMWAGALCEVPARLDADAVWDRLASGEITVFTAVPTIYHRLIASWDAADAGVRRARSAGVRSVRLMMSGSAALPLTVLGRWREITGHVLLERYGMTEIGMALSNPLHGDRRPGHVGAPLPGVEVRLVDEHGMAVPAGTAGELEVRGPGVFLEYWQQPDATREAFRDGWFRTGDMAVLERGSFRLHGRTSTDILKVGGYKVSALEIEDVLRRHPAVAECAVVGVPDPEWGQRVCAAVELKAGRSLALAELDAWARDLLAPYKIPRALCCVAALPRNAMGKVVKPDVALLFSSTPSVS